MWDASQEKLVTGPYRNIEGPKLPELDRIPKAIEKQLCLDEATIIEAIASGSVQKRKARQTINSIASLWLEASKPPVYADATWRIYKEFYDRYIADVFGDRPVNKVSAVHVQRYVNLIKEKYSPETVNKCITILTNIFSFAINPLKEITANPVAGIKRMKVPKRKREVWNDEIIQYFLNLPRVKNSPYYPMLCISLILGSRPGEICGLKDNALRDSPFSLVFDEGLNKYGQDTTLKTDGSHRELPIPEALYRLSGGMFCGNSFSGCITATLTKTTTFLLAGTEILSSQTNTAGLFESWCSGITNRWTNMKQFTESFRKTNAAFQN